MHKIPHYDLSFIYRLLECLRFGRPAKILNSLKVNRWTPSLPTNTATPGFCANSKTERPRSNESGVLHFSSLLFKDSPTVIGKSSLKQRANISPNSRAEGSEQLARRARAQQRRIVASMTPTPPSSWTFFKPLFSFQSR